MQTITKGQVTVNYLPTVFGGWVAFKNGKLVRTKDRRVRKFKTADEAIKAGEKSLIGLTYKGRKYS